MNMRCLEDFSTGSFLDLCGPSLVSFSTRLYLYILMKTSIKLDKNVDMRRLRWCFASILGGVQDVPLPSIAPWWGCDPWCSMRAINQVTEGRMISFIVHVRLCSTDLGVWLPWIWSHCQKFITYEIPCKNFFPWWKLPQSLVGQYSRSLEFPRSSNVFVHFDLRCLTQCQISRWNMRANKGSMLVPTMWWIT